MVDVLAAQPLRTAARRQLDLLEDSDRGLLLALAAIVGLGLVMVASASVAVAERTVGDPTHYLVRQLVYLGLGAAAAGLVLRVRLAVWQALGSPLLGFGYLLLALVLVPGVGHEVNGASRWLDLGLFNLQVSEVARVCVLVYLAAYLVRRAQAVQATARGFLIPVALILVAAALLLGEPDFGAAVVLTATGLSLVFIAGAPLGRFALLALGCVGAGVLLVVTSPYRWQRLVAFRDPWADPFDSGFQLTQSLIAVGRGEWFGVGLGNSVQKLFYLPEAHTDFLFAVLAEELGFVGMAVVIGLYAFVVWRACAIGAASFAAGRPFGGYLAYGVGVSLGLQAFVNMGVNLGLLPTKGLTLPLMSYGGSSLVMTCVSLGLLLRVDVERRRAGRAASAPEVPA
ncbi:putative lipid II flippase FtsW [Sediminicurvatus halobius]|uniref:Probable peptidoglycan glycosyltransferase FtsW n=1 Tax=Sediminicurvatus halobius TaxID=2182432 RepID=A0A2U2N7M2_9GAMM|nr:putative lipid II flippase FtsW [Spiribacter halobius]PWG65176.1 putative lipid II flippase FtsW [Spiribacter halobius]UEX78873.1 putative lipid II flippase FtsW [Spiribacter halobius]